MKTVIAAADAPKALGPYSQAVTAKGLVFLSGQVPLDPQSGELVTGSIQEQTTQVLKNLSAVLRQAGLSLEHVVKTTVFLKDIGEFQQMNEAYARFFSTNPPARSTVEVARLPRDVRVEIDAIAIDPRA
ncbi:MAG: RidA family protein [Acidobacteriaceae bacterium]|nr:RidA family protein [Acidobacteriaceae bacterium]